MNVNTVCVNTVCVNTVCVNTVCVNTHHFTSPAYYRGAALGVRYHEVCSVQCDECCV